MKTNIKLVAGGLLFAVLAGCGQTQDTGGASAAQKAKSAQSQSSADPFVKAVTITVGETPVELRFELPERPQPKQPVPMHLRLTGLSDSTALTLKVSGNDHVQIVGDSDWTLDSLPAGQAHEYDVSVRTDGVGVFVVDAAVQATRDSFAKTFSFAIPMAVPDPAAAASSASSQSP